MGMFKDIKKLSAQGKEAEVRSGRRSGMIGRMRDLPDLLQQSTAAIDSQMADMDRQQGLLTTGTPGSATIKGITDTGTLVNHNPQVVIDMEITVEGQAAYAHQLTTPVPQIHIPMIQPGSTIGVRVDPADPSSVALDWARPQG